MQFDGILLVDKPQGMTSHDVVDVLRKVTGLRRIGHTGTLDPRATGLLVMCLGQATRLSQYLSGLDKTYEGAMQLGVTTRSHDLDGEVVEERPVDPGLTRESLQTVQPLYRRYSAGPAHGQRHQDRREAPVQTGPAGTGD